MSISLKKRLCKCGHVKAHHDHGRGECFLSKCRCERYDPVFKGIFKGSGVSTYSTGTPPPGYAPSPDPEPIRW